MIVWVVDCSKSIVALSATFTVPLGVTKKLLLLVMRKRSTSPLLGSVAERVPTTVPAALFSATLPPLAQAIAVGASLVSTTLKVSVAALEEAVPSLTVKSMVA